MTKKEVSRSLQVKLVCSSSAVLRSALWTRLVSFLDLNVATFPLFVEFSVW